MTINTDIEEAIKKNLSSEVGQQLQKVLAQGEKDAAEAEILRFKVKYLERDKWSRNLMEDTAKEQKKKEADLQTRDKKLAVREGKHVIRMELSQKFMDQYNLMWAQAFSSPEGKKLAFSLFGSTSGMTDGHGNYVTPSVNLGGDITEQ